MALLQKLKSLLGLTDSSSQQGGQRDVGVTVEHEGGGQASTATENAVKGTDAGTGTAGGQPAAADTDAAASTGSMTDADAETAAEPAEAAGPVDEAEGEPTTEVTREPGEAADEGTAADDEASEAETDAVDEAEEATEAGEPEVESEDVDVIKGIGPAYAGRLADVGIETVADLAAADAEAIAAETDLSETRVGQWIERAKHR